MFDSPKGIQTVPLLLYLNFCQLFVYSALCKCSCIIHTFLLFCLFLLCAGNNSAELTGLSLQHIAQTVTPIRHNIKNTCREYRALQLKQTALSLWKRGHCMDRCGCPVVSGLGWWQWILWVLWAAGWGLGGSNLFRDELQMLSWNGTWGIWRSDRHVELFVVFIHLFCWGKLMLSACAFAVRASLVYSISCMYYSLSEKQNQCISAFCNDQQGVCSRGVLSGSAAMVVR